MKCHNRSIFSILLICTPLSLYTCEVAQALIKNDHQEAIESLKRVVTREAGWFWYFWDDINRRPKRDLVGAAVEGGLAGGGATLLSEKLAASFDNKDIEKTAGLAKGSTSEKLAILIGAALKALGPSLYKTLFTIPHSMKTMDACCKYTRNEDTILSLALKMGCKEGDIKKFIDSFLAHQEARFLLNRPMKCESYPLYKAAQKGYSNVVATLLKHGARIDYGNPKTGQTAFHTAAANGYVDVLDVLLNANHSLVDGVDRLGNTALLLAVEQKHESVVNLLLYPPIGSDITPASPNISNTREITPLMAACKVGNSFIIESLIKRVSNVNERDLEDKSALGHLIESRVSVSNLEAMVTLFMKHNAEIDESIVPLVEDLKNDKEAIAEVLGIRLET